MSKTTLSKHEKEFLQRIGAVITYIRRNKSLKQSEFADSIGVTQAALSKYENGQTNIPILSLKSISDKYDVGITDFFVTTEKPSQLFKRMLKAPDKPMRDDKVFDEYISRPENTDKMYLLISASHIVGSDAIDRKLQDKLAFEIEHRITENANNNVAQRLMAYAGMIRNQRKND